MLLLNIKRKYWTCFHSNKNFYMEIKYDYFESMCEIFNFSRNLSYTKGLVVIKN